MNYAQAKKKVEQLFKGTAKIVRQPKLRKGAQCAVIRDGAVLGFGGNYEEAIISAMQVATAMVDKARAEQAKKEKAAEYAAKTAPTAREPLPYVEPFPDGTLPPAALANAKDRAAYEADAAALRELDARRCCPRDTDGDGNCDVHSRPGVLRRGGRVLI